MTFNVYVSQFTSSSTTYVTVELTLSNLKEMEKN